MKIVVPEEAGPELDRMAAELGMGWHSPLGSGWWWDANGRIAPMGWTPSSNMSQAVALAEHACGQGLWKVTSAAAWQSPRKFIAAAFVERWELEQRSRCETPAHALTLAVVRAVVAAKGAE